MPAEPSGAAEGAVAGASAGAGRTLSRPWISMALHPRRVRPRAPAVHGAKHPPRARHHPSDRAGLPEPRWNADQTSPGPGNSGSVSDTSSGAKTPSGPR